MSYNFPIIPVVEYFGGGPVRDLNRSSKIICMFHEEDRPSMSVDPKTNRYKCWSCEASGDALEMIKILGSEEDFGACVRLAEEITQSDGEPVSQRPVDTTRRAPSSLFGGGSGAAARNAGPVPGGGRGKPRGLRR